MSRSENVNPAFAKPMLVKLNIIQETEKAYKLDGNGWIPKSVLDNRGLNHPYYQIKGWWLQNLVQKIYNNESTQQEKEIAISLSKCTVRLRDLSKNDLKFWQKYWSDAYNSLPPLRSNQPSKYKSKKNNNIEHYNDIGSMTDLSFQDLYGNFGY